MAKVSGPLQSFSASGKLAECIVFFTWKGRNVVRQWLKPANPQSTDQGDRRIIIGGVGRAVGKIVADSDFHDQLITLELIPGGQTKQSYLVKYILDNYLTNATTYVTELAALTGFGIYTTIQSMADDLIITEFDLDYATIAPFDKALGLYLIAKAAIALNFAGSPYSIGITTWTRAQWESFAADFTA